MIHVSSYHYTLAKTWGHARAQRMLREQNEAPRTDSEPTVRMVHRMRMIDEVVWRFDTTAIQINRARSIAFSDFVLRDHESDLWVSLDDDIEATMPTIRWAIDAARSSKGVVIVPYLLRVSNDEKISAVLLGEDPWEPRQLANGGQVVPATHGGFGFVVVHREAAQKIAAENEALAWELDDGSPAIAIFYELLWQKRWFGEDLSFFHRIPGDVTVEALVTGECSHAGQMLRLEDVLEAHRREAKGGDPPCTQRTGNLTMK